METLRVLCHRHMPNTQPDCRWYKVVRMVVMRQRCTRQALKDAPVQPVRIHTNTVPFSSFFGSRVSGPQLSLVFLMHPPDKYPGHPEFKAPPPAELDVEVMHEEFRKSSIMHYDCAGLGWAGLGLGWAGLAGHS